MSSTLELPCLFCVSKSTKPEEYENESMKFEAEEIYKLLCSLLGVKLRKTKDIFYLLWNTSFIPLCKSCSILFRNLSQLATVPFASDRPEIQEKLNLLVNEIRVKVQKSEREGYGLSKTGLEFAIQRLGPSTTRSAKQTRAFLEGMQRFRQKLVKAYRATLSSSNQPSSLEIVNGLIEGVSVKQEIVEDVKLFGIDTNNTANEIASTESKSTVNAANPNNSSLLLVNMERIVKIKAEKEKETEEAHSHTDDMENDDLSDCDDPKDTNYELEAEPSDTSDSGDDASILKTNDPDWEGESGPPAKPRTVKKKGKITRKLRKPVGSKRLSNQEESGPAKPNWRIKNILADSEAITKSGGHKCDKCNVAFIHEINLLRHKHKYHSGTVLPCQNRNKLPNLISDELPSVDGTKLPDQKDLQLPNKEDAQLPKDPSSAAANQLVKKPRLRLRPSSTSIQDTSLPKEPTIVKCDFCDDAFTTKNSALRHIQRFHSGSKNNNPYSNSHRNKTNKWRRCSTNEKYTDDETDSETYMEVDVKPDIKKLAIYRCETCGDAFRYISNLQRHIKNRHSGKKRVRSVDPGIRRPQEVISEKCSHCGTVFTNAVNLKRHIRRIHNKSKEVSSNNILETEDLGKSDSVAAMKRKQRICRICQEVFTDTSNLNRHIKAVHFVCRIFECPDCKRTFNRSDNLKQHQKRFH